jgi:opacity protein-like surface antigen
MQKFFVILMCSLWVVAVHAETEPVSASIGSVEDGQHKTTDDMDTAYLQELAKMSHAGPYALGFVGLGYHKSKLVDQHYKDKSGQYGAIVGYGRTLENKRYWSLEGVYTRDLFDKHKSDNTRFRQINEYELVGRYGKIIQANFLPYMRLGVGYQNYQYFSSSNAKTSFHGVLLTPGVGVQVFVRCNAFIRAETSYQFATKVKSKGLKVNRKPQGPAIWGGVGLVF